jgi:hypothetical protein
MTEHQKMINRARKVAALMGSPVAGEKLAAAEMLKKILDQYNLSVSEIGLEYIDHSYVVNNTNNEEADDPDIIEINYKQPYHSIQGGWHENLVYRVCLAYGVKFGVQGDTIKIIGFRSEVDAVKAMIINLREHIQSRISVHHFANERQTLAYASCFTHKITKGIYHPKDTAKLSRLSCYMYKHYSLLPVESNYDGYFRYDFRTFVLAQVDARDFAGDYRCRKAA